MHERDRQSSARTPGDLDAPGPMGQGALQTRREELPALSFENSSLLAVLAETLSNYSARQTPILPRHINEHILHLGTMTVALNLLILLATVSFSSVLIYEGTTHPDVRPLVN